MKILNILAAFVLFPLSASAQSWPDSSNATTVEWGMNRTVSPYQVGIHIGTQWYPIGTITSGGTWTGTANPGITGDCVTTGTNIICTKTNGVTFKSGATTVVGTSATYNLGTAGATIPLLSTSNTWDLSQTFSSTIVASSFATSNAYATTNTASQPGIIAAEKYVLVKASSPIFPNTLSATECGTGATIAAGSSNQGGQIKLSGTPTTCSVKFTTPYPNYAYCSLTPAISLGSVAMYIEQAYNGATALPYSQGFRIHFSATPPSAVPVNYTCTGN